MSSNLLVNFVSKIIYFLLKIISFSSPDFPLLMGFEPLVNQRLLPPTFPRYAKIVGREQAIEYFEAFMMRLLTVCDVIHVVGFHSIIVSLTSVLICCLAFVLLCYVVCVHCRSEPH